MTSDLPEEEICEKYSSGINANELSKIYNCDIGTIIKRLQNNGIEIRSRMIDLPIEEICEKYLNGISANKLSKIYNCDIGTIIKRLRNNDIEIKSEKIDLPEEDICEKYLNGVNIVELAEEYGCCYSTIIDRIRSHGIELYSMSEIRSLKLPEKEICDKYINGTCIADLGKEYNCSDGPIRRIVKDNNIKIRSRDSDEIRRLLSSIKQGISYDEWESFAWESPYCPAFNEKCRESNREKYNRKCFLTGLSEEENITSTGKIRKLSVHHVDMDKGQGCNDKRWKLVPLCMSYHSKVHNELWETRIIWLLDNVWNN